MPDLGRTSREHSQDDRLRTRSAETITSHANPLVKRLRSLRRHPDRAHQGVFLVEGILPVWRALENNAAIETLVVASDLLRSADARNMLEVELRTGRSVAFVSSDIFEQFAGLEHPSGLAAIVRIPSNSLEDLSIAGSSVFTALFEPGNPGNLGTIVRTVEATGGAGVIIVGRGTDPYHPTAVKASMGTIFSVPVVCVAEWQTVSMWAESKRLSIVTTSAHARDEIWDANLQAPCIVALGSEAEGLPREIIDGGDHAVRIPMAGPGSLNLAVAAAVLLYEIRRQQRAHRSVIADNTEPA
jgi:TrmH family RNA methyltransferase